MQSATHAVTRRRLIAGLAGFGAASAAGVASASPAGAVDGDPLTLGIANTSSTSTTLTHEGDDDDAPALAVKSTTRTAIVAGTGPELIGPADGVERALYAEAHLNATGLSNAIEAVAGNGFSVWANNDSAGIPSIHGANNDSGPGLGALSVLHGPQLVLVQENLAPVGPPTKYADAGSIRFDGDGDLWLCLATGEPGTWTRLLREDTASGRTVPVTPTAVLDTRATGGRPAGSPAVPGQKKGPLVGGTPLTLDLAGVGPIPATATGVIGNLTVTVPTQGGHLAAGPSGTATTTSTLNFTKNATVANAFTCLLGPDGLTLVAHGVSMTYHLIVDITAYIT